MKLQENEYYEQDLAVVIDMLLDDEYHRQKVLEARGGRNYEVLSRSKDRDRYHIKIKYDENIQLPDDFPSRYKKFVSPSHTYITTMEWFLDDDERKVGTVKIELQGLPVTVHGHLQLQHCDGGCERIIDIKIDYNMPIIGRYLSGMFSGIIRQSLNAEYEFNRSFLTKSVLPN